MTLYIICTKGTTEPNAIYNGGKHIGGFFLKAWRSKKDADHYIQTVYHPDDGAQLEAVAFSVEAKP